MKSGRDLEAIPCRARQWQSNYLRRLGHDPRALVPVSVCLGAANAQSTCLFSSKIGYNFSYVVP